MDTRVTKLYGGFANDLLTGYGQMYGGLGNDQITTEGGMGCYGGAGNDLISGGTKDAQLFGEDGHDNVIGQTGKDSLSDGNGDDTLQGGLNVGTLRGDAGNDLLQGQFDNDLLNGGAGNDSPYGFYESGILVALDDAARDTLYRFNGDDSLTGGKGADTKIGDLGLDVFVYTRKADSLALNPDEVAFAGVDKIDLSSFDGSLQASGTVPLTFITTGPVRGGGFASVQVGAGAVRIDSDGDRSADMLILIIGGAQLGAADFLL